MNAKSLGMLVMAVVCGLGAMFLTTKLLSRDKGPKPEETQDVVVAVRDMKVEEVVKPEMVKVVRRPVSAVPAGAFSSVKDVEGRWVQVKMLTDEPLVDPKLAAKGSPPGLVARIPKGMRAFAVEVNEQTGVSGFVLPDHRVDVVQIHAGPKAEAETVLQDVLVLASGQTMIRPEDRAIQVRTVTLAVTPEQVDVLVAAKQQGALTLALRGLNDHEQMVKKKEPPPEPVKVAEKPPEPPPPPPPPPPEPAPVPKPTPARYVTIYRVHDRDRKRIDAIEEDGFEEDLASAAAAPPK